MLVSPLDPDLEVVAAIDSVITSAFSSILFDFFYYSLSSNCITEPYREYYGRFFNGLGL